MIYLDNNATTRSLDTVVQGMLPFYTDMYGNPSSLHTKGAELVKPLKKAIGALYDMLDAHDDDDIIITSGGTEGNNHIFQTILFDALLRGEKPHCIISAVEHHCILYTARFLESRGVRVTLVGVDHNGQLKMDELQQALCPETRLVAVMMANNETGVIYDVASIVKMVKNYNPTIHVHTDGVQAIGKIPVSVRVLGVDSLSFSAHKFHGPKGVGGLYLRRGHSVRAFLYGGGQMKDLRSGTENVPGIIGMGIAAQEVAGLLKKEQKQVAPLRDLLETEILKRVENVVVLARDAQRVPNTSLMAVKGVEGEALLWDLNKKGVCASTGSACSSSSLEVSHVLRAMNLDADLTHTGVRFSLSCFTTEQEIRDTVTIFEKVVFRLREISLGCGSL